MASNQTSDTFRDPIQTASPRVVTAAAFVMLLALVCGALIEHGSIAEHRERWEVVRSLVDAGLLAAAALGVGVSAWLGRAHRR